MIANLASPQEWCFHFVLVFESKTCYEGHTHRRVAKPSPRLWRRHGCNTAATLGKVRSLSSAVARRRKGASSPAAACAAGPAGIRPSAVAGRSGGSFRRLRHGSSWHLRRFRTGPVHAMGVPAIPASACVVPIHRQVVAIGGPRPEFQRFAQIISAGIRLIAKSLSGHRN